MSHFVVLVQSLSDSKEELASRLQPFHEFECTGTNDEYVQTLDTTEALREEYKGRMKRMMQAPDGTLHEPSDDAFYRDPTPEEIKTIGPMGGMGRSGDISWYSQDWGDGRGYRAKVSFLPEGFQEIEIPIGDIKNFREFVSYHTDRKEILPGEPLDIEGEHKFGYTLIDGSGDVLASFDRTNPNRKWDWYEVGGRYSGFLKAKPGVKAVLGKKSWANADEQLEMQSADLLQRRDIDLEGMMDKAEREAREIHAKRIEATKGLERPVSWEKVREEMFPGDISAARDFYNNQPMVQALRKADLDQWSGEINEYFPEDVEVAVRQRRDSACVPFAFLDIKGNWHERGKMHMFAVVSDESDADVWNSAVTKMITDMPADQYLFVVDCHI